MVRGKIRVPKKTVKLKAHQLLDFDYLNDNIKSVRFQAPKLGKSGYGHFMVEYKHPVLVEEI